MNKKKIWSLNIPIKSKHSDKEINKFLSVCKDKLGLVPNIIKTNTIDKKKFNAFNIFYNRLMQDDNFLSKIEKEIENIVKVFEYSS